ncbi:MAG TPA: ABC transporter substrate-binding protein [Streptosporangiaceae bacterium]|nr:ABC transporter substrate-binding protein [Streptosporangiaceae bacterium]
MNRKLAGSVVAAAVLALGIAACGSSPSSASSGKPLTIVTTAISPMTDNFNPFLPTSIGYVTHSVNLYDEPLMVYNTQDTSEGPVHELATGAAWSNGGTTLTITTRSGVKWSDGKPFSASDVAFTFNLIKNNSALNANWTIPTPTSVTATNATTTVLTFSQPELSSAFYILQTPIVPEHVWQDVSNPVTYADPTPVGTGPYVLDHFSSTGYTMKENPYYYARASLRVPELSFPAYGNNANLLPPCSDGTIDWCGISIIGVSQNYLAKSKDNKTWTGAAPYFSDNNVVGLWFNVTKAPLNDPAVRQAISYAINRQQLSTDGESNNEPPETSTAGMILPAQQSYLPSSLAGNIGATGAPAKVSSILTADGYKQVGGKWEKNGQQITFNIEVPVSYTDYYTDAQLLVKQLNAQGFNTSVKGDAGTNGPDIWTQDLNSGNFDSAIHWGAQGLTPYFTYNNWMNYKLSAPLGQTAGADYGRFDDPAAQAALSAYQSATTPAALSAAVATLANIEATEVPVAPLLQGASWAEFSSRDYTGWPTKADAYMDPGPNIPEMLAVIQQLKPVS